MDSILRGRPLPTELRYTDENGEVKIETAPAMMTPLKSGNGRGADRSRGGDRMPFDPSASRQASVSPSSASSTESRNLNTINIYAYGLTHQKLEQAAKRLRLPLNMVDDLDEAQALVTLKTYYRRHQRPISDAEERGVPVYVLRSNTVTQMENFLADMFQINAEEPTSGDVVDEALRETKSAIDILRNGEASSMDLSPRAAAIRRRQHEMAREAQLVSHSYGREPYRRVRIFRE